MIFNKETIKRRAAYFIFWAWHLIYTVLIVALVIPTITWPLIQEASSSSVPLHYILYALILVVLPFVSMFLGAKIFHGNYRNLMKYFYGFEMPLTFFLLVRIMTFRDSNPGVSWLILNVSIALIAWFIFLLVQHKKQNQLLKQFKKEHEQQHAEQESDKSEYDENTPLPVPVPFKDSPVAIAASTIIALVGLYFGTLFFIIMFPLAVNFIAELGQGLSRVDFEDIFYFFINPLIWLLAIFVLFTMSLFIALPVMMIYLYVGQFVKRLPSLLSPMKIAVVCTVIAVSATGFIYLNQQPQQAIFTLLDEKIEQEKLTDESRKLLLMQSDAIKAGLLNAYLARYRYVSTAGLSNRIQHSYKRTFNISADLANIPQTFFNNLAVPFLYDGKNWDDKAKAEHLYEAFFDAPIQKAERQAITDAVKHNWEMSQDNEAGLLDALSHYVHLNKQSIDVAINAEVATVVIKQTLENLTYQQREAVMHFSLPEDAVLTGVWLSDIEANPKKYAYVLAPKGAAQAVYKAEVNRRVDPALLEQTGPRQYRLRVYPILPKSHRIGANNKAGKRMYMQFEYQTLVDVLVDAKADNAEINAIKWPLPKILEKRNLFWDHDTEYWVNGEQVRKNNPDNWLPEKAFHKQLSSTKNRHTNAMAMIQGVSQTSVRYRDKQKETLPTVGDFALLIDGSYSMQSHRAEIIATLKKLQSTKTQGARYSTYFCRESCQLLKQAADLEQQSFFGFSQTADHVNAFLSLTNQIHYDAIMVLSDEGSYELMPKTDTKSFKLNKNTALWLVHLGETVPYAYDDKILDTIYQSKGGITHSLNEALLRYQLFKKTPSSVCNSETSSITTLAITKDRIWQKDNDPNHPCDVANNPALIKIATAQKIKHLINSIDLKTNKLETLDSIHTLAKSQGIVSHYSSMLVLVNDRQKEALKKAEAGDDRFDREIETGKQSTTNPADPFAVPSVPEPEEWALMIIIGLFLSYSLIRRRYGVSSGGVVF